MKFIVTAATLLFSVTSLAQSAAERAGLKDFSWKTGQVIAISEMIQDPTTFFFEAASGSRFGHIGIVVVDKGQISVYESDPLVKGAGVEPLDSYLARSEDLSGNFNFTILEPELTAVQAKAIVRKAKQIVAKRVPYNFKQTFLDDASKLNCSEFVYRVFEGVASVGELQTVSASIKVGVFNGGVAKLNDLMDGGRLPQPSDRIVSPLSIVKSPALRVVKSTLPVAGSLSESEIFNSWDAGGGFVAMIASFGARAEGAKDVVAYIKALQANPATAAALNEQIEFVKKMLRSAPLSTEPIAPFPASFRKD